MKKVSKGFTLIELMVVIAILAIMLAIAIPMYQNYLTRARLGEVFSVVSGVKSQVIEYYSFKHMCPVNASGSGMPAPTDYATSIIEEIEVVNTNGGCDINVKLRSDAPIASDVRGETISLQLDSANTSGAFSWTCTSTIPQSIRGLYLPRNCQ